MTKIRPVSRDRNGHDLEISALTNAGFSFFYTFFSCLDRKIQAVFAIFVNKETIKLTNLILILNGSKRNEKSF